MKSTYVQFKLWVNVSVLEDDVAPRIYPWPVRGFNFVVRMMQSLRLDVIVEQTESFVDLDIFSYCSVRVLSRKYNCLSQHHSETSETGLLISCKARVKIF